MDMVTIMLNMIRASREGNWELHLSSVREMIPWCFSYDMVNYARYLSAYYVEMTNLPTENPEVNEYLHSGNFSVQLSGVNPFGKIPVDQTIEETINKDTQTSGGTKGFSLQKGAINRYYMTAEYRSAYMHRLKDMIDEKLAKCHHDDLSTPRIARDEKDVVSLIEMMESNWINPFVAEQNGSCQHFQPEGLPRQI